jgi:hypothetical protein
VSFRMIDLGECQLDFVTTAARIAAIHLLDQKGPGIGRESHDVAGLHHFPPKGGATSDLALTALILSRCRFPGSGDSVSGRIKGDANHCPENARQQIPSWPPRGGAAQPGAGAVSWQA